MAIALVALLLAGPPEAVLGRWRTETRGGIVEIARCGGSICGTLLTSDALRDNPALPDARNRDPALRARPLKGLRMLGGFAADGNGWSGGKAYNPDDGGTYSATIRIADPDHLKLRGCILFPLCKTELWTRVR